MMRISTILMMLCLGLPLAGHADTKSDAAFNALRKQGIEKQQRGDLDGALQSLEAAARLKNAPNIWLNIVSVHADRSKAKNDGNAFCSETESALTSFFDACDRCASPKASGCSACRMMRAKGGGLTIAAKSQQLAQALKERGNALQASVAALPEDKKTALTYRATGLIAKSAELTRCLESLQFTSTPPGAQVNIAGTSIGQTPMRSPVFIGTHTFAFEKVGFTATQLKIRIPGKTKSVHAQLVAEKRTVAPSKPRGEQSNQGRRLAGWVTTGLGTIALATAGTFLSIGLDKRDEAQSINGQFGRRSEFDGLTDESRTAFMVSGITTGVGMLAVGAGIWLLLDDTPSSKQALRFQFSPSGVGVAGAF